MNTEFNTILWKMSNFQRKSSTKNNVQTTKRTGGFAELRSSIFHSLQCYYGELNKRKANTEYNPEYQKNNFFYDYEKGEFINFTDENITRIDIASEYFLDRIIQFTGVKNTENFTFVYDDIKAKFNKKEYPDLTDEARVILIQNYITKIINYVESNDYNHISVDRRSNGKTIDNKKNAIKKADQNFNGTTPFKNILDTITSDTEIDEVIEEKFNKALEEITNEKFKTRTKNHIDEYVKLHNERREAPKLTAYNANHTMEHIIVIPQHNNLSFNNKEFKKIVDNFYGEFFPDFKINNLLYHNNEVMGGDNKHNEGAHIHLFIDAKNQKTNEYDFGKQKTKTVLEYIDKHYTELEKSFNFDEIIKLRKKIKLNNNDENGDEIELSNKDYLIKILSTEDQYFKNISYKSNELIKLNDNLKKIDKELEELSDDKKDKILIKKEERNEILKQKAILEEAFNKLNSKNVRLKTSITTSILQEIFYKTLNATCKAENIKRPDGSIAQFSQLEKTKENRNKRIQIAIDTNKNKSDRTFNGLNKAKEDAIKKLDIIQKEQEELIHSFEESFNEIKEKSKEETQEILLEKTKIEEELNKNIILNTDLIEKNTNIINEINTNTEHFSEFEEKVKQKGEKKIEELNKINNEITNNTSILNNVKTDIENKNKEAQEIENEKEAKQIRYKYYEDITLLIYEYNGSNNKKIQNKVNAIIISFEKEDYLKSLSKEERNNEVDNLKITFKDQFITYKEKYIAENKKLEEIKNEAEEYNEFLINIPNEEKENKNFFDKINERLSIFEKDNEAIIEKISNNIKLNQDEKDNFLKKMNELFIPKFGFNKDYSVTPEANKSFKDSELLKIKNRFDAYRNYINLPSNNEIIENIEVETYDKFYKEKITPLIEMKIKADYLIDQDVNDKKDKITFLSSIKTLFSYFDEIINKIKNNIPAKFQRIFDKEEIELNDKLNNLENISGKYGNKIERKYKR